MRFAIINSSGNAIEWFEDEPQARAALAEMVAADPAAAEDVDLLGFDTHGQNSNPLGNPHVGSMRFRLDG